MSRSCPMISLVSGSVVLSCRLPFMLRDARCNRAPQPQALNPQPQTTNQAPGFVHCCDLEHDWPFVVSLMTAPRSRLCSGNAFQIYTESWISLHLGSP